MKYYLDDEGLSKLWERIQKLVYQCGGGGGGCSCSSLTTAEIDAVTPMECYQGECDESDLGTLIASGTGVAEDAVD